MIAQETTNPIVQLAPLLLLVGIFYFLLIRPQQRRLRQQRELIESVEVGDEVLTIAGIFGVITGVDEDEGTFEVEIAPGTRIKVVKSAVNRRLGDEPAPDDADEEANEGS